MISGKPDEYIFKPDVNKIKPEDIVSQKNSRNWVSNDSDYIDMENNKHRQSSGEINIDICFREAPIPYSTNHIDLVQNTAEW